MAEESVGIELEAAEQRPAAIQPHEPNREEGEELETTQPRGGRKVVVRPPCQIAQCQAPVQACLRPGMWLPGVRNLHSARETWEIKAGIEAAIERLVAGVEGIDTDQEILEVHKVDKERNFVQIYSFTAGCNWLDVVEVKFQLGKDADTTIAEALSFSSGMYPAWIPLAFLYNMCCCYAPFSGNGMNTKRLETLRNSLQLDVQVTAETKCNCCPS